MNKSIQADAFITKCKTGVFAFVVCSAAYFYISACNKVEEAPVNHAPPIAIAGEDIVIKLPLDSVWLDGTGSKKTVADINFYGWYNLTTLPANIKNDKSARTLVTGLVSGTYFFQLRIRDADNLFSRDTIKVIVKSREDAPLAVAGNDFKVEFPLKDRFELNAKNSSDNNNNIKSYSWRKLSGPHAVLHRENQFDALVTNIKAGTYSFELKVTDSTELFSLDTVRVEVVEVMIDAVPRILLPCEHRFTELNEITLAAYNTLITPDGLTYPLNVAAWSQVSGPTSASIENLAYDFRTSSAQITNLGKGTYVFRISSEYNNTSAFKDITVHVVEDTISGKEYYMESSLYSGSIYMDNTGDGCDFCYTDLFGMITRPDLFYDYQNKYMRVFYKLEGTEEWIEAERNGQGPQAHYYFTNSSCPSTFILYPKNPLENQYRDKKILIRISFKR